MGKFLNVRNQSSIDDRKKRLNFFFSTYITFTIKAQIEMFKAPTT